MIASRDHADLLDNWGLDAALELGLLLLQLAHASGSLGLRLLDGIVVDPVYFSSRVDGADSSSVVR